MGSVVQLGRLAFIPLSGRGTAEATESLDQRKWTVYTKDLTEAQPGDC